MKLKQHIVKGIILVTSDECEDTYFLKEIAFNLFAVESTAGGESYRYGVVYADIEEALKYIRQTILARNFAKSLNATWIA